MSETEPLYWFIRDDIRNKIEQQATSISRLVVKTSVDYVTDFNSLYDCIDVFLDCTLFTAEELTYAVELVQQHASYLYMVEKGYMEEVDGKYQLTETGRKRQKQLQQKRIKDTAT